MTAEQARQDGIKRFMDAYERIKAEGFREEEGDTIADCALMWARFVIYLNRERANGATEFRIGFNGDHQGYVHPLGKDGQTIDIEV